MNKPKSIDEVIDKIEHLRSSLKQSDDLLPLLSDMFHFIKDIIPLMIEANVVMTDSSNKIPSATEHINEVSKTTETATHEVLDKLDKMVAELEQLQVVLNSQTRMKNAKVLAASVQEQATEIVYAFQFQDITAQQLAHVNKILQAIYNRFLILFKSIMKVKANSELGNEIIDAIRQDLKMSFENKNKPYFDQSMEDNIHRTGISQEKIDQLFKE